MTLEELFRDYPRIVVAGGPVTGKTIVTSGLQRLAQEARPDARPKDLKLVHSDDIMDISDPDDRMREKARTIIRLTQGQERYIVAGVAAHVALKYGLPADCIVLCTKYHGPKAELLPGQKRLKSQAETRAKTEAKRRNIPLIPFRGRNDYRWDGLKVT